MTTFSPATGALETPTSLLLTGTGVTDVYAMAAGRTDIVTVTGIIIANAGSGANLVSVWWTENSTDYLIYRGSLSGNTTETDAVKHPIRLYAKSTARKIRAQAATGNEVTVTVITTTTNEQTAKA